MTHESKGRIGCARTVRERLYGMFAPTTSSGETTSLGMNAGVRQEKYNGDLIFIFSATMAMLHIRPWIAPR